MHIFSFFRTLITVIVLLGGGWLNTVEPIRDLDVVMDIAEYLKGKSDRNYVMFMFGIYTGLRISDILKFRVRDVRDKDAVYIREKKTGKEKIFCVSGSKIPSSDIFFSARVKIAVSVSTDLEDDVIFFIKDF